MFDKHRNHRHADRTPRIQLALRITAERPIRRLAEVDRFCGCHGGSAAPGSARLRELFHPAASPPRWTRPEPFAAASSPELRSCGRTPPIGRTMQTDGSARSRRCRAREPHRAAAAVFRWAHRRLQGVCTDRIKENSRFKRQTSREGEAHETPESHTGAARRGAFAPCLRHRLCRSASAWALAGQR